MAANTRPAAVVRKLFCHINSKRAGLILLPSLLLLLYLTLTDRVADQVEETLLPLAQDRGETIQTPDFSSNPIPSKQQLDNGGYTYQFEEKDLNKRMQFSTGLCTNIHLRDPYLLSPGCVNMGL